MSLTNPTGLAEMIEDAKRTIASWPPEVRRALGIPDEPPANPGALKCPTCKRPMEEVQVSELREYFEPSCEPGTIQRICHAFSGGCVMITDPEREPCTAETCLAVRAAQNRTG